MTDKTNMDNVLEFITKILTKGDAWITNGQYRLFEKNGEYIIAERKLGLSTFSPIKKFSDLKIAIAEYANLATEGG